MLDLASGALLDVLGEDYMRTARGRPDREQGHLPAWATQPHSPVVAQFGADLGPLLGGAIVVDGISGLPGLGALALSLGDQR